MNKQPTNCECCTNYFYDYDDDCYICLVNLDEDEMMRFLSGSFNGCPYFRLDDEYSIAKKQQMQILKIVLIYVIMSVETEKYFVINRIRL